MHSNIARLRAVCRHFGLQRGHRGHGGHGGAAAGARFGYNERLFLGTLAAGGTLGILIPPSINMIVYAVLTNTSVPKLYLAGIIPGHPDGAAVHGHRARGLPGAPGWGGKQRSGATWANASRAGAPAAAAGHLSGRGGLDLRRHRHAHRGRRLGVMGRWRWRLVDGR
jgi:C4-dicarboxylate transporter DctM subunit